MTSATPTSVPDDDVAIRVRDLRRDYGTLRAVDGVSFDVARGEVYALLGRNGAGKSTTVEILEGHRPRTSGQVSVLGFDPATGGRRFRDRIGIVLQSSGVETELSVREVLRLYGSVYSERRDVDELLDVVELSDKAAARIGTLSGGQRRRLDLALGIVGRPEVLFLDEPTTGFDPSARRRSWDLIRSLCSSGTTVLLTTHYLDEAEHLADRVGVLAGGRLVAEDTPRSLVDGMGRTVVSFSHRGFDPGTLRDLLPPSAELDGDQVRFTTSTPTADVHRLTSWAVGSGLELEALTVARPSLEDVFLGLAAEEAP
ncbi:MAG: ABC transporter ATP-binding protein [Ilumatobacteraceae bacterium]